jgi:RimJ/RimL family protein N-acetyltransferase
MEPVPHLVPFTAGHLAEFAVMAEDPDVLRFTRFPDPPKPTFPAQWLARYESGRVIGTKEAFAIAGADGALLGVALAVEIDRAASTAELGYLVDPAVRGRGIATFALRVLTAWARDEQGLERLTLIIDVGNEASKKVAERAGYVLTRIERDAEIRPGRRGDLLHYDWPAASDASGAPHASRSSGGGTL